MDFTLDENQQALQRLAAELFQREATTERLTAHERGGAAYDVVTWKALAQAGLLGVCLPEDLGGAGMGAVELAVLLREAGAHVAPVPLFATLGLAAPPVAEHGTPEQRALLAPLPEGDLILTAAAREPGHLGVATTAHRDGCSYVIDGVKTFVPQATGAAYILVPAQVEGAGIGVFLVDPRADGLTLTAHPASTGEPMSRVALDAVRVPAGALLGGIADGAAWATLTAYATAASVATVSGVLEAALKLTTEHVKHREQFDRPLAQFQAVTMQVGDVYVAKRALDVVMWAGVWRLAESRDDVAEVLAMAAYNVCGPALQALYTCQHLHGGLGLDVTYPLHRYFAWGKHHAHLLGGEEAQLDTIGALVGEA